MKIALLCILLLLGSPEGFAQRASNEWQAKAVEKYPEIGVQGSELNKRFVQTYRERMKTNPEFFNDPKWPLALAEELAGGAPQRQTPVKTPTPNELNSTTSPATPTPPSADHQMSTLEREAEVPERSISRPETSPQPPSIFAALFVLGIVAVIVVGVFVAIAAIFQRRSVPALNADDGKPSVSGSDGTLWVGRPSHLSYFWNWFWGVLLLPLGLGFIIIAGIFLDRARRLYVVTSKNVLLQYGLLAKSTNEIRIKDIRSINVTKRGIPGILGIGSVEFSSAASDRAEVIFDRISGADSVRDIVRYAQEAS